MFRVKRKYFILLKRDVEYKHQELKYIQYQWLHHFKFIQQPCIYITHIYGSSTVYLHQSAVATELDSFCVQSRLALPLSRSLIYLSVTLWELDKCLWKVSVGQFETTDFNTICVVAFENILFHIMSYRALTVAITMPSTGWIGFTVYSVYLMWSHVET